MNRIIIFDFDGVLVDSVDRLLAMNQEVFGKLGKTITKEQYVSGFEGHINQGLTKLFNLSEEEKETMTNLKAELHPTYYRAPEITLFDFAEELVKEASKLGELWIVSSTPHELIANFLEPHGLVPYFAKIVGQNKQPKNIFFQSALADKKKGEVFFITDTTGDIKAMRTAGVDAYNIAVSWGFHHPDLLAAEKPDLLAKSRYDIIDFIQSH